MTVIRGTAVGQAGLAKEEVEQGLLVATMGTTRFYMRDEEFQDPEKFRAAKDRIRQHLIQMNSLFIQANRETEARFQAEASANAAAGCLHLWKGVLTTVGAQSMRDYVAANGPYDLEAMLAKFLDENWKPTPDFVPGADSKLARGARGGGEAANDDAGTIGAEVG